MLTDLLSECPPVFPIAQRCRENAMKDFAKSRRGFLRTTGAMAGGFLLWPRGILAQTEEQIQHSEPVVSPNETAGADYTLRIETSPVEIVPKRIISITTYNGQFPGPLLRFKEGQQVTVDVFNDTDTPEQLHWHGQKIPSDVDGASEEGTPFIPAHGKRRIVFTPRPAGLRFYHTHNRAGANLAAGQYSGQVGPVVHRAQTGTGQIRPRSLSCPKGIRAHVQSRRRHGHGFPVSADAR
jgi:FtsP/CotA-like multicopper oxidase with cupredoxin domain